MRTPAFLLLAALLAVVLAPGATATNNNNNNDPCNGIWYNTYDLGTIKVGTNLNPGCTHVDVYLPPVEQCVTEGDWYPVRPTQEDDQVTVWEYRCGAP